MGLFWLTVSLIGAFVLFWPGITLLFAVWQMPEYSHGPLIPVLSGLLFLRQLKTEPILHGPVNRWPGLALLAVSVFFGILGQMVETPMVTATALILWFGAILLICFGWEQGKRSCIWASCCPCQAPPITPCRSPFSSSRPNWASGCCGWPMCRCFWMATSSTSAS
jgi:hypothetical protein